MSKEMKLLEALSILNDIYDGEACRIDHEGQCQEHYWFHNSECPHARAKRFIADQEGSW